MSCVGCKAKEMLNKNNIVTNYDDISCGKLNSYDWLNDMPQADSILLTEVRFKNTRKEFFLNKNNFYLKRGDYVAVEAIHGFDVGQVTLTGKMAELQFKKKKTKGYKEQVIYRKATLSDIEKWQTVRLRDKPVMIQARKWVAKLGLKMKISDVEFQADGSKAIFYYIADERVDFRELIKHFAREFNVRVEMRQIGARQEAAMIGGIGSCGNELCCSAWRTNLATVSGNAARIQELPQNIQKLTGQCGKLKCCLMYEMDSYLEAQKDFPDILLELETEKGIAYPKKREVLKRIVWYGMSKTDNTKLVPLSIERIKEIIMLNKKGIGVSSLTGAAEVLTPTSDYTSFEADLSILDKKKPSYKKNKKNYRMKLKGKKNRN